MNDVVAVTKPRRETRWNLLGCPKHPNRSQPLMGRRSLYCGDICCLTIFFPIIDTCLSCDDSARQRGATVSRWRFFCVIFTSCIFSEQISDLHSKFPLRPHHVWCGMVHIHSATSEIRRGKKKKKEERRKKKKPQDENIMSASATQGGHNKWKMKINQAQSEYKHSLTFRVRAVLSKQRTPCTGCKSAQQCTTRGTPTIPSVTSGSVQ